MVTLSTIHPNGNGFKMLLYITGRRDSIYAGIEIQKNPLRRQGDWG